MMRKIRSFMKDERGAILMEYIILTLSILFPLVLYDTFVFNVAGTDSFEEASSEPQNILFNVQGSIQGDFGYFGNRFVEWYQRMMCGLALPIP